MRSLPVKTVLFQVIPFSISLYFSPIWPLDWTLLGVTTQGRSGSGGDGIEEVFGIPQNLKPHYQIV